MPHSFSSALADLPAARQLPDYSVTLTEMARALKAAVGGIERIEPSPPMSVELIKASPAAGAEDRKLLQNAREMLARLIGQPRADFMQRFRYGAHIDRYKCQISIT